MWLEANVLIDKEGNPCICDFGISKVLGHRGFTTTSVGTAPYMAPELFFVIDAITQLPFSPKTTQETDVYSFGLLVLEVNIYLLMRLKQHKLPRFSRMNLLGGVLCDRSSTLQIMPTCIHDAQTIHLLRSRMRCGR